jgi:GH25 family lysozyme M1 (1,4-beta-N-acetylmuramidase)
VLALQGQATTSVLANLRVGAPNRAAPIARKLAPATSVGVTALVLGEAVGGNPNWYRTADGLFLWSGACAPGAGLAGATPAPGSDRLSQLTRTPRVVDLSHGDGLVSFTDAKAAGVVGVIHKATTGATGRDDAYRDRRALAVQAGLLWGAYHWGTAAPVADQVKNYLDWAEPDAGTLLAVDFETTVGNQMTLDGLRDFCAQILAAVGRRPVIYAGGYLKDQLGGTADPALGAHRLWLAQYGPAPKPQASWPDFWLWQYTDGESGPPGCCKTSPGLPGDGNGRLDCNYFEGSTTDLTAQWAG